MALELKEQMKQLIIEHRDLFAWSQKDMHSINVEVIELLLLETEKNKAEVEKR